MARILFLMMLPFVCFSQITPREDIPVNNILKEKENLNTKRKAFYNLDEIKVRWKKAALENCPGVPCVVAPSFTSGTSTVSAVDGNSYETVAIGNQCWMKSNLRVMNYNNNDPIPDSTNSTWGTAIIGARTGYDVSVVPLNDYVGTFGYLYNWYAVNDARKICPSGWHVPTDAEWTILIQALDPSQVVNGTIFGTQSNTAGTVMKSQATNSSFGSGLGWNPATPTPSPGTNTSGFSALPGGIRFSIGSFGGFRSEAQFWSATDDNPNTAIRRKLQFGDGIVYRLGNNQKSIGYSVRCLRD
ncbi:MAG: fibrobacter succinogenes major paralogous domain-containing protein [Bacteroidota bacterium]